MDHRELLHRLGVESEHLVSELATALPQAMVPTCPGWDVTALAHHVGGLYRWSARLVRERIGVERWRSQFEIDYPDTSADAATLAGWVREGASEAIAAFTAADPYEPVWAWGADQHARFWPRRMLFETAVHRADAKCALGDTASIEDALGVEGIDEHLENLPFTERFGTRYRALRNETTSIGIATGSHSWRIALGADGLYWDRGDVSGCEVVLSAAAGSCYLTVLGRLAPGTGSQVSGNRALLERFLRATAF